MEWMQPSISLRASSRERQQRFLNFAFWVTLDAFGVGTIGVGMCDGRGPAVRPCAARYELLLSKAELRVM